MLPDMKKSGVKPIFNDDFSCKLPDDIYEKYMELRKEYADYAVIMMKKELQLLKKSGLENRDFIIEDDRSERASALADA